MEKTLTDYIFEYRTRGSKNKAGGTVVTKVDDYETKAVVNMGNKQKKVIDIDKLKGKDPFANGSHGKFAIDEPTDNDVLDLDNFDPDTLSINERAVMERLAADEDFMIIGRAGWGKTQIIKKCAKKFKRAIVTVYLDKIAKEDLGGIPVPKDTQYGNYEIDLAMPGWAAYVLAHPEQDFLIFFDEMNQATPDVQNALMPIILEKVICGVKFDNFICCGAGNFSDENEAVYELSGPLKQRLGNEPIIWESHNEESWKASMEHLKNEWLGKINSEELFDLLAENAMMFESPRLVENYILKNIYSLIQKPGIGKLYKVESFYKKYKTLLTDEAKENSRKYEDALQRIAEVAYNIVNNTGTTTSTTPSRKARSKNALQINNEDYNFFKEVALGGEYEENGNFYAVTRENFGSLVNPDDYNAEQIELIKMRLDNDVKWKFQTNEDFFKKQASSPKYKKYKLAE